MGQLAESLRREHAAALVTVAEERQRLATILADIDGQVSAHLASASAAWEGERTELRRRAATAEAQRAADRQTHESALADAYQALAQREQEFQELQRRVCIGPSQDRGQSPAPRLPLRQPPGKAPGRWRAPSPASCAAQRMRAADPESTAPLTAPAGNAG